jgi:hypothetical protein
MEFCWKEKNLPNKYAKNILPILLGFIEESNVPKKER